MWYIGFIYVMMGVLGVSGVMPLNELSNEQVTMLMYILGGTILMKDK